MTEEIKKETGKQPRITIDYLPGRNAKVFHIFDNSDKEITLSESDARRVAKNVLKITKGED